MREDKES